MQSQRHRTNSSMRIARPINISCIGLAKSDVGSTSEAYTKPSGPRAISTLARSAVRGQESVLQGPRSSDLPPHETWNEEAMCLMPRILDLGMEPNLRPQLLNESQIASSQKAPDARVVPPRTTSTCAASTGSRHSGPRFGSLPMPSSSSWQVEPDACADRFSLLSRRVSWLSHAHLWLCASAAALVKGTFRGHPGAFSEGSFQRHARCLPDAAFRRARFTAPASGGGVGRSCRFPLRPR